MAGVGVLFAMIMYVNTVVAFASVTKTEYRNGYGNVTASQELTEEDYNLECWVTLKTETQVYTSGMKTYVNYNLAYNDTGASITGDVLSYTDNSRKHTIDCDLSDYGFYEDNGGNLALFSAHYATGNVYMKPIYLSDVY